MSTYPTVKTKQTAALKISAPDTTKGIYAVNVSYDYYCPSHTVSGRENKKLVCLISIMTTA